MKPDLETPLLLGGAWLPLTQTLTFFEGAIDEVVDAFLATRGAFVARDTGCPMQTREVFGDLPRLLAALEPLTSAQARRYLFMPTRANWTAYLDNDWRGTDSGSPMTALAARGRRSVAITNAPNSYDRKTRQGFYGIRRFELAWPSTTAPFGFSARAVGVRIGDRGRWEFDNNGPALPFEDISRYALPKVQERVPAGVLRDYASGLGVYAFEESFYAPARRGVLIEHKEPPVAGSRQFTLEEARSGRPFETIGQPTR